MLADSVVNAHSLQKGRATESVFYFTRIIFLGYGACVFSFFSIFAISS